MKLLSYLKPSIRFWFDFTPKLIREIMLISSPKTIKVSSKIYMADRVRARGSQEMSIGLIGLCLFTHKLFNK